MRTFSVLNERTVFDIDTGTELGKVEDLLFNEKGVVVGLVMDKKGWLNRDLFVPIDAVTSLSHDVIMVDGQKGQLEPIQKSHESLYSVTQGKNKILGKTLMTTEGEKLGLVEDVYFMEEMGIIVGYEVTEGLLADIKEGRKVIRTNEPLTIGEDILVINLDA
ncbi:PRC-barrel domain-containing protein [Desertibacillus haloalkaliphilus]|uniref:PRC-barrel domain-containing protein n=1 Tax=Desertibacillus haloalkaliphilus TaxID=1328930 RepID=UPI001C25D5EB|nr:PRC-barrel domain-containing protein [Desertibacillus haloalkaliphilus]MBU8905533.1 PRC-barrel domain-containing protein [Desertibacillus haloalkaliphilus]